MCQCTPEIKTPFCGKGNCQWPKSYIGVYFPLERPVASPMREIEELHSDLEAFMFLEKHKNEHAKVFKEVKLKVELT